MCYFGVVVLGRVDEKCASRDSTDISEDKPSLDQAHVTDEPLSELQHVEVNSKFNGQCSEEKLPGL